MNSTKMISLVTLMTVAAFTVSANADILRYDKAEGQITRHSYQFYDTNATSEGWQYASAFKAKSDNLEGDSFRVFCVDQHTYTSSGFSSAGQTYNTEALNSPSMTLYNQQQKDALNSLFSHVYSTVFDNDGNYINSSNVASYVYQLAVWEIVHEQSGEYAVDGGTFGITGAKTGSSIDNAFYNNAVSLANSWFDAIAGRNDTTWDSIGYNTVTNHELTIYVAGGGNHISQTFISVVNTEPRPEPADEVNATPEPATMLIFGLGIVGLGIARRRMK